MLSLRVPQVLGRSEALCQDCSITFCNVQLHFVQHDTGLAGDYSKTLISGVRHVGNFNSTVT